jgi:hypothetical protein
MGVISTHLANHISASSREEWLHQQADTAAPDRNRHHANSALDAGAPSTHDPTLSRAVLPKDAVICSAGAG